MAFGPSKTSAAQTAYNAGANITAALIASGAIKFASADPNEVVGSTLEVLGGLVAAIRNDLEKAVAEELAETPAKAPYRGQGGSVTPIRDPASEKLTQTGKHAGKSVRQVYAEDKSYVTSAAKGDGFWADADKPEGLKFPSITKKARAFLASLPTDEAPTEPQSDDRPAYL